MPGFFDFSNAGAGPITGQDQQGWMQNILGQGGPIAPETNDIFGTGMGKRLTAPPSLVQTPAFHSMLWLR